MNSSSLHVGDGFKPQPLDFQLDLAPLNPELVLELDRSHAPNWQSKIDSGVELLVILIR
jgi:hypothetical protein